MPNPFSLVKIIEKILKRNGEKSMKTILFTGCTLSESQLEELKKKGFLIKPQKIDLSEYDLIKELKDCDGYILGGEEIATAKVIESAKSLKVIGFYGAGYERYVDTAVATQRGIPVTNTPQANAPTVAEFTVALILTSVKKIALLNEQVKSGTYAKQQLWNLKGKTLGIIGMGAIGTLVAKIMHNGFGMKILYVSRSTKPEVEKEIGATKVNLNELLQESDVISIHVPYSPETIGMIGKKQLELMQPHTVLINTARAELVDGHALHKALTDGKIAAAAFDCYYTEPTPKPSEDEYRLFLLHDDKFIITPHTAFNSIDAVKAMENMVVTSVLDALSGKEPKYIVNPDYAQHKR